jgi:hypothetical protein
MAEIKLLRRYPRAERALGNSELRFSCTGRWSNQSVDLAEAQKHADVLMAEPRGKGRFRELLHLGWPTAAEIAADLSSFTTQDHRDSGRHTLVLHSGDLPSDLDTPRRELGNFVDRIYEGLTPPISYRDHRSGSRSFPSSSRGIRKNSKAVRRERPSSRGCCARIRAKLAAANHRRVADRGTHNRKGDTPYRDPPGWREPFLLCGSKKRIEAAAPHWRASSSRY